MNIREYIKMVFRQIGLYEPCRQIKARLFFWKHMLKGMPREFRFYFYNYIITYIPIHALRLLWLKFWLCQRIGKGCFIHLGVSFYGQVEIGDDSVIGKNVCFLGNVKIGSHCSISAESYFLAESHEKDSPIFIGTHGIILVDDYAWIGTRSMIMLGIHVGEGGVLGAQSVLTKDIPPYTVWAGSPAKKIGVRASGLDYTLNYFPFFN